MEHEDRTRRRDAAATREALLHAAQLLMARHGVEGTSTRDVAAAAGVNQALVYRYFGSKEKLFAEAAGGTTDPDRILADTPLEALPGALLARVLDGGLTSLVSAANDETVRTIIRDRIDTGFGGRLAGRLDGPDPALRAELLAALVIGIGFLKGKVGTAELTKADPELLGEYVDTMVRPLLEG